MRTAGQVFLGIFIFVLLIGAAVGLDAADRKWYEPWVLDTRLHNIRHSQENVDAQQVAMREAWKRYIDPNATQGQKKAALDDWCAAADKVDSQYRVPSDAVSVGAQTSGCLSAGVQ